MVRKILLWLLGVAPSIACAADLPTVKIGGRIDTIAGYVSQKDAYANVLSNGTSQGKVVNRAIVNDTKIDINIDGENEFIKYGGLIQLNADTSKSSTGQSGPASKTMAYIQNDKIGRLEGGNYYGAGAMLGMDNTSDVAVGAYGIEGFWSLWASDNGYINAGTGMTMLPNIAGHKFIVLPDIPSNYGALHYSVAPKITFYTLPIPSVTLGVSFIPDLDSTGTISTVARQTDGPTDPDRPYYRPTFKNIVSGGVQFKEEINGTRVKASVVGEIGQAKKYLGTNLIRDLKAYELGLALGRGDVTVAATYGSWLKTGTYKQKFAGTKQGSEYWTLGAAYKPGPFGCSLTFMKSKRAGGLEPIGNQLQNAGGSPISTNRIFSDTAYNKFTNVALGAEYKVTNGMMPYVEVSRFLFKDASGPVSNIGSIYLAGMRLRF